MLEQLSATVSQIFEDELATAAAAAKGKSKGKGVGKRAGAAGATRPPPPPLQVVDYISFEEAVVLFRELCVGQPASLAVPVLRLVEMCNFGQRGWARFVVEGMRAFFGGGKQSIEAYRLLKAVAARQLEMHDPSWR
jgi:hypothetical protein